MDVTAGVFLFFSFKFTWIIKGAAAQLASNEVVVAETILRLQLASCWTALNMGHPHVYRTAVGAIFVRPRAANPSSNVIAAVT